MIKLDKKEPRIIGCFPFIIFTFLSFSTLYKLYIWLISINQTITIRKIIPNRIGQIVNRLYNRYKPKIQYFNEIIKYGHYKNFQSNNNAPRELPLNNNINNVDNENSEQLNLNHINIQIKKYASLSTDHISNKSKEEL